MNKQKLTCEEQKANQSIQEQWEHQKSGLELPGKKVEMEQNKYLWY